MEPKRLPIRAMLQSVFNFSKDSHEQLSPKTLTIPLLMNPPFWNSAFSTHNEGSIVSQTPRSSSLNALGSAKRYDFARAQRILQTELNRRCMKIAKTIVYDAKFSADFARDVTAQIRRAIKNDYVHRTRYKLVILSTVVQIAPSRQSPQSMILASRCLWNTETDGSITAQSQLGLDMMAVVTVFVIYTE